MAKNDEPVDAPTPKSEDQAEEVREELDHPGKIPGEGSAPNKASGGGGNLGGEDSGDSSTTGTQTGGGGGESSDIGGGGE